MSGIERGSHEDAMENWRNVQAVEDEMLEHVKEIAQRIAARVRNVLGKSDYELLSEVNHDAEAKDK